MTSKQFSYQVHLQGWRTLGVLHVSGCEGGIMYMVIGITINLLRGNLNGLLLHLKWPFKCALQLF